MSNIVSKISKQNLGLQNILMAKYNEPNIHKQGG